MSALPDALGWTLLLMSMSGTALMLRSLSRRLGEALKMRKYYLLYDASIAIFAGSAAWILLSHSRGGWAVAPRLLFLAGSALMVGVTARYWGWIVPEMLKAIK